MKWILAFALGLLVATAAGAQPQAWPCQPIELGGTGSRSVIEVNRHGVAAGWWCGERAVRIAATWQAMQGPLGADLVSAAVRPDRNAAAADLWARHATTPEGALIEVWEPLLPRLAAAKPAPAPERWAVPKAAATANPPGTRPTYRLAAGALQADGGRVAEGAPCDMAARHTQGAQVFGSVLGQAAKLALCVKVPS